jgi:hypothetical protein
LDKTIHLKEIKNMEKPYKVEIAKTAESIVNAIRFFDLEFGESYLEYNDIFTDSEALMNFALEKEYISTEKFDLWKKAFDIGNYETEECNSLIFGEDEECEPYCIAYENDELDEDYDTQYEKALLVYGELICSNEEYFNKFVEEYSSEEGNLCYVEVIKVQ